MRGQTAWLPTSLPKSSLGFRRSLMPQAVVWPCFIIATFKGPPPFNWAAFRSYAASGLRGVAARS